MIDLRSDTFTLPSPEMREFMMKAEVGDDVFGEDPTVNNLQEIVANMTGKEAALFVCSGTQGNQVSINAHTQPGDEVICDYNSHIFNYESGGPSLLSGVQLHPVYGQNGHLNLDQISQVVRPVEDHFPQTKLICLENTHNRAGGTIYPLDEIKKISNFARENKFKMHLDGARLWNASIATGISLCDYASFFDSVSLCFSKGLGAPIGSIVAGTKEFINRSHYYRKAYGGGMRQVGIIASACIYAIKNNFERLNDDHENAGRLAEVLYNLAGFNVDVNNMKTNIVIAEVSKTGKSAFEIVEMIKKEGILAIPFSPIKIRFVTHIHINRKDIDKCIDIFNKLF